MQLQCLAKVAHTIMRTLACSVAARWVALAFLLQASMSAVEVHACTCGLLYILMHLRVILYACVCARNEYQ